MSILTRDLDPEQVSLELGDADRRAWLALPPSARLAANTAARVGLPKRCMNCAYGHSVMFATQPCGDGCECRHSHPY